MSSGIEQLQQQIKQQGDVVRQLKADKAEKLSVDEQVAVLLELKNKLSLATGGEDTSSKKKQPSGFTLKPPKVTYSKTLAVA